MPYKSPQEPPMRGLYFVAGCAFALMLVAIVLFIRAFGA